MRSYLSIPPTLLLVICEAPLATFWGRQEGTPGERENDGRFTFDSCMEPWIQWQPSRTIPCPPQLWGTGGSWRRHKMGSQHICNLRFPPPSYLCNIIINCFIFANRKENQVKRVGFLIQTTFLFRGQILVL